VGRLPAVPQADRQLVHDVRRSRAGRHAGQGRGAPGSSFSRRDQNRTRPLVASPAAGYRALLTLVKTRPLPLR
jgi:hypothetical protein